MNLNCYPEKLEIVEQTDLKYESADENSDEEMNGNRNDDEEGEFHDQGDNVRN
jgi:hypothetical protein